MKLLVLLSRFPYPLEKGDKLRAFNQIKRLSEKHEIILCCLSDRKVSKKEVEQLRPFCTEIVVIRLYKLLIFFNLVRALFTGQPFQVAYFYFNYGQKKVDRLIEKHLPKHIFCQLVRVAQYTKKYTIIPKTLDYMDALATGAERRIESAPFYLRPFLKIEAKRLGQYENHVFGWFDNKVIISQQDRELIGHPKRKDIKVIPNGVDIDFYHPIEVNTEYELSFTGNMNYPPNIDSARFLVRKILPEVQKYIPRASLIISGANPASSVTSLQNRTVTVTGWVEDIRNSYAKAKIFIAPMKIGTGLQNKLLEAMAMKIPCITSPLANNALGAKPEDEILIGETPEEYANQVRRLLQDEELYQKIAENGYRFVLNNYNWDTTTANLEQLIAEVS